MNWLTTWWSDLKAKKARIRKMRDGPNTFPEPGTVKLCQVYQVACNALYWVQNEIDEVEDLCCECAGWESETGVFVQVIGEAIGPCNKCGKKDGAP